MKMKKKSTITGILNKKGFSLAELLMTTLIMLLATTIVTTTVTLAIEQYNKSHQLSGAQQLCTLLSGYVKDELAYAKVVTEPTGSIKRGDMGQIVFASDTHNFGPGAHFVICDEDGNITSYVNENEDIEAGRICEKSILYGNPPYNLAGAGAYRGEQEKYKIVAGMALDFADGAFKVHIWVEDRDKNVLAENYFLIVPIEVSSL